MARPGVGVCGLVVAVSLLGGCGSQSAVEPAPGKTTARSGDEQAVAQARLVLARFDALAASPRAVDVTSDQQAQSGDWEPAVVGDKLAVLTGHVTLAGTAAGRHAPAVVRWADGRVLPVRTVSARSAFGMLKGAAQQPCGGCATVVLSDPRLVTRAVQTTTGDADVPAWSFGVRGSRVRLSVVAVDAATKVPALPELAAPPGEYVSVESARLVGPRTLELGFTGAQGSGRVACGADYAAAALESAHAVVVLVREHPHRGSQVCAAVGHARSTTVHLAAPLTGRAVLDAVHGQAVPLVE